MSTTFADKALPLAQQGIPVFPCNRSTKAPLVPRGFLAASTDPDQIAAWSNRYPDALAGMPTGGAIFVLDIDVGHADGADGFATLRERGQGLPPTRTHHTRSGGRHVFFATTDGMTIKSSAGKLGLGLDVRGEGGYVIRWDTEGGVVEHSDIIVEAPAWLVEALQGGGATPYPLQPLPGVVDNSDLGDPSARLGLTLEQIIAALAVLDSDLPHDEWLRVGMALHHETDGAGFSYWDEWSASSSKYPGSDVLARRWHSFAGGDGVTARSLLKMARDAGAVIPTVGGPLPAASIVATDDDAQTLARLAALPLFEYERVRKEEAERLGVRAPTLDEAVQAVRDAGKEEGRHYAAFDDVEPWPHPVSGEALLADVARTIKRFIVCDSAAVVATTLWCATTWLVDSVHACPLLLINAPEKACGKTQLLTVVGKLVPRPAQAAGISPSVLFRMIEKYSPTLLVDEIETVLTKEAEDLRGLFNAGHTRDSAFVWRSVPVGDDFEPRRFSVFGFKAIAGINADQLAETVTSRAIVAQLRRRKPEEQVQRLRHAEPGLFDTLQRKLARWAADNANAIRTARPTLPDELGDRDQDNWEPLLAVADRAGGRWGAAARAAAVHTCNANRESSQSVTVELLTDIKAVFEQKGVARISMQELRTALVSDEEAPWATWSRGQPISVRRLGQLVKQFGIESTTVKLAGGLAPKGYRREDFRDAFERYLYVLPTTPISSVT
ncbi:DUF3631 domain-containing protein [Pusillimonas sp. MFBS29]|uniref:DUF3631 domain-containing protein n=1 Tax=Pusillimonas sp. MFBS29 TaxID=2886690 RepID=UPI001D110DEB|nr:DUF3631 domain-containing protein [Pusillimonas sp. MFBS29]MCC2596563.1 DUF3631 domain-containing protein [Pusillimonas sp. MFBS29]